MSTANDPERFTVKEILTNFIQPTLEEIREKLDSKASVEEVAKLSLRVDNIARATAELPNTISKVAELEQKLTTPDKVAQIVEDGLQASKTRGWTTRERFIGVAVALTTMLTFVLNVVANH